MSREHLRLPMHGRDHLPGGSDPIPGLQTSNFLSHKEGCYHIPSPGDVTIAAGAGVDIDWSLLSGDSLFDLTNPALPVTLTAGLYTVDVTWSSISFNWTVGATTQGTVTLYQGAWAGNHQKVMRQTIVVGANNLPSAGDTPPVVGFVSATGWLEVGDSVSFHIDNLDSGSRDMSVSSIEVSLLYSA